MTQKYEKLHGLLLAAISEIAEQATAAGVDDVVVNVTITKDRYDGLELKYSVGRRYSETVTGNDLAPAVAEFLRRYGWNTQHNTKLISNT